jgi:hypothetical protein
MPVLVIQQGHCYRASGATGTTGEQQYATRVGNACMRLLNGKGGWTVRLILADAPANQYRGDAFFAIHCDGSTSSSARGASVGYRNAAGQQLGQAWKRAYEARGWDGFRPDNYTAALSGYYGTGTAVAQGNSRAVILECGFRTNPQDLAALDGPGGVDRVALAIGDALGIPTDAPQPTAVKDEDMQLIKGDKADAVFVVNWSAPGAIAVRKRVPNAGDPGYQAARAAGYEVKVVPQAVIDAIPDDTTELSVDLEPVVDYLEGNPPVAAVSAEQVAEIARATAAAVVAEFKKEGN